MTIDVDKTSETRWFEKLLGKRCIVVVGMVLNGMQLDGLIKNEI